MATTATMTGAQFDALPYEEGRRWELVQGELIEVSGATWFHRDIAYAIAHAIKEYFRARQIEGRAGLDVEFALTDVDRVRPDVCAVLGERIARIDFRRKPVAGAPDLAVEIISPSERAGDIQKRVESYFANGTSEVWQVYPRSRVVEIRKPGGSYTVTSDGEITSDLLPGLRIPVASIFEV